MGGLAGWEGLEGTGLVVRFRGVGLGGGGEGGLEESEGWTEGCWVGE